VRIVRRGWLGVAGFMRRLSVLAVGLTALGLWAGWSTPAWAADFRAADAVRITEPATEDLYLSGGRIAVEAPAAGDVIAAGGDIALEQPVGGSVLLAGGTVSINGPVQGSIRAAAGNLTVSAAVERDVVVTGGNVAIAPSARIAGDLVAGSGSILIEAPVEGDVYYAGGRFTLAAPVAGDVLVEADQVVLADGASVAGNLIYRSPREAVIAQGAQVAGSIRREASPGPERDGPLARITPQFWRWVASVATAAFLLALAPGLLAKARSAAVPAWRPLGVGILTLAAVPFAALVAAVTVVGLPVAIIGVLAYAIALYLAQVFTGSWLGASLANRAGRKVSGYWQELLAAALGMAILRVAGQLPWIGGWVGFLVLVIGLGLLAHSVRASLGKSTEA
ncbi:MAG TPA: polymer-forming cytoskeletal protein, partial [Bacillota bacterium]